MLLQSGAGPPGGGAGRDRRRSAPTRCARWCSGATSRAPRTRASAPKTPVLGRRLRPLRRPRARRAGARAEGAADPGRPDPALGVRLPAAAVDPARLQAVAGALRRASWPRSGAATPGPTPTRTRAAACCRAWTAGRSGTSPTSPAGCPRSTSRRGGRVVNVAAVPLPGAGPAGRRRRCAPPATAATCSCSARRRRSAARPASSRSAPPTRRPSSRRCCARAAYRRGAGCGEGAPPARSSGFAHHPYTMGAHDAPGARLSPGQISFDNASRARAAAGPLAACIRARPAHLVHGVRLPDQPARPAPRRRPGARPRSTSTRPTTSPRATRACAASPSTSSSTTRTRRPSRPACAATARCAASQTYAAYRLPIYPVRRGGEVSVYGQLRPAPERRGRVRRDPARRVGARAVGEGPGHHRQVALPPVPLPRPLPPRRLPPRLHAGGRRRDDLLPRRPARPAMTRAAAALLRPARRWRPAGVAPSAATSRSGWRTSGSCSTRRGRAPQVAQRWAKLGVDAVRIHARWRDRHDLAGLDAAVDAARGRRPEGPADHHRHARTGPTRGATRASPRQVARRYRGRIARYLIWNEPNIEGWLRPQAAAARPPLPRRSCAPRCPPSTPPTPACRS